MDILEEEELERISGLLQRDNLVRGLGIVEHVYRLLHCTPGTMGVLKSEPRPLPPPLVGIFRCVLFFANIIKYIVKNFKSSLCNMSCVMRKPDM